MTPGERMAASQIRTSDIEVRSTGGLTLRGRLVALANPGHFW